MAEYIDREAASEALSKLCKRVCQYSEKQRKYMCDACPLGDAFTVIEDDLPVADVRPVVRAHWKPRDIRNVSAVCSNCGHLRLGNGAEWATKLAYFCEKCGADMRPEPAKEE